MISKFQNVERAVAYLCEEFAAQSAAAHADVSLYLDGMHCTRSRLTPVAGLRTLLLQFCHRFPEATVVFVPRREDTPIAAMQCRCSHQIRKICQRQCRHHRDRPMIGILLCDGKNRPTEEERRAALDTCHEHVHQHYAAERKRRDSGHRPKGNFMDLLGR